MNTPTSSDDLAELDLAVPSLDTAENEIAVGQILRDLRGVEAVRIIERGVWLSFRPSQIHHEAICEALREGGFDASVFQDSETGETGTTNL